MRSFDDLYVLNLHGNSLKREICPDGSPDQNVFDIRQGVAIAFFVKRGKKKGRVESPRVRHAEIWGLRDHKYQWLEKYEVAKTDWRDLDPKHPFYLFIPRDEALGARYEVFPSVSQIFPVNSVGIVTARDNLTIHWSPEDVWRIVTVFSRMDHELARQGYELGKDAEDWKITWAQKDLMDSGPSREKVVSMLYRPFDIRHTYYTGKSSGFHCRPRPEVMHHMLQENLALITPKQNKNDFGALVSETIGAHKSVAAYDINYYFPLYLYPEVDRQDLFSKHKPSERQPNLNQKIVMALKEGYGKQPTPEQILHYIYAVLYVPAFREKYAEFLRSDFPRVPFTADRELFTEVAGLGQRLTELHLLCSAELDEPAARFVGAGDARVTKSKSEGFFYEVAEQRVYINKTQNFAPVPEEVWEYQVGGYQVCEKWLKDRKGRKLDHKDIQTYCRIVTALKLTIEIQEELDALYPQIEKKLLEIALNP
jgi:predicted helicase